MDEICKKFEQKFVRINYIMNRFGILVNKKKTIICLCHIKLQYCYTYIVKKVFKSNNKQQLILRHIKHSMNRNQFS